MNETKKERQMYLKPSICVAEMNVEHLIMSSNATGNAGTGDGGGTISSGINYDADMQIVNDGTLSSSTYPDDYID